MKILIVAHFFPPEHGGAVMASQRPYSWAKYWSQMGHDIVVLTTAKAAYPQPAQTECFRIQGVNYWPARPSAEPPLQSASPTPLTTIKERGYQFLRTILLGIYKNLGTGTLLFVSNTWSVPAIRQALRLYQTWPFEVVISTYGPPCSHIVGGILKRKLPVFWVADYRDLWHGYDFLAPKWPFSRLEQALEDFLLVKADLVTAVSDGFAQKLSQRFHKVAHAAPNGFETDDLPPLAPKSPSATFTIVHTGNIYPQKRDPSLLFQALCQLRQEESSLLDNLEVRFYGWDLANLLSLIEEYKLQPWVKILGYIDRKESLKVQRQADFLLYLDWLDPLVDGVIGGKLYEYMFAGRPILAVGASRQTIAGRIIEDNDIGLCTGQSIEQITSILKKILAMRSFSYTPNPDILNKYSRKTLAKNMISMILAHKNEQ
jgi:glycosyltransferase involved in cell wall biosynthesis